MAINSSRSNSPSIGKFTITKAEVQHAEAIQKLAIQTFQESHGHSAPETDIQDYIALKFTVSAIASELKEANNLFHLVYLADELVAYSKIVLNSAYKDKTPSNSAKLERLYVLQKFHGTLIGKETMDFNIQLAKDKQQNGLWLYVWTENHRAICFYQKYGFQKIDDTVFQISARHTNPNFILYSPFTI